MTILLVLCCVVDNGFLKLNLDFESILMLEAAKLAFVDFMALKFQIPECASNVKEISNFLRRLLTFL